MSLELRQVQALKQELRMTPQLQQAIELLQYNRQELAEFLKEQLEENPALEQKADERDESAMEEPSDDRSEESLDEATDEIDWEEYLANTEMSSDQASGAGTAGYVELPSIEDTHADEPDLAAHLLQQLLERLDTTEREEEIAHAIIFSLDDQGFFRDVTPEELAATLNVEPIEVEDALALVQEFEPVGIAARDVSECLYLQIVQRWPRDRMLKDLVRHHLDDLEAGRDKEVMKALDISADELAMARERLKELDPWPAREFAPQDAPSEYITPDVRVFEDDGKWVVTLTDENLPQMKIAQYYRDTLRGGASSDAKAYVREKLNSASFLIRSIEQRRRTIRRVAQAIVDVQSEFFTHGPARLKPLILKDIAEMVDMHESTISRVTREKYMDTPRGTIEFKYFFNAGIPLKSGGEIASEAVRYHILHLVKDEDPTKPLSDSAIADELLASHDIEIARRTVAKYRESLNIPSSTKRRIRH
jgi:RNA polymerase sigma-54 factor